MNLACQIWWNSTKNLDSKSFSNLSIPPPKNVPLVSPPSTTVTKRSTPVDEVMAISPNNSTLSLIIVWSPTGKASSLLRRRTNALSSISLHGGSNCFYHSGDTNSSTTAEHLDAGFPAGALEVVNHLPKKKNPGRTNGVAQRNGATCWIDSGI